MSIDIRHPLSPPAACISSASSAKDACKSSSVAGQGTKEIEADVVRKAIARQFAAVPSLSILDLALLTLFANNPYQLA